jgi:Ca2+-binding EF-hand superfamily protein
MIMKYSNAGAACLAAMLSVLAASSANAQQGQDQSQMMQHADGEDHGGMHKKHHGENQQKSRGGMRGHHDRGEVHGLMKNFDTDGDGSVAQEEIDAVRLEQITKFDSSGDGSLDLSEYEALWLDAMRERMVDRFQAHDDDGDGSVTPEEFNEDFEGLVERMDRNDDGVLNSDDRGMRR